MVILLDAEIVLTLHERVVAETEETSGGLRDIALLESSVGRMSAGFGEYELYPTLFEKAAALLESIIRNHPFVDGNKRTALASAATMLRLNGWITTFGPEEAVAFALDVEARRAGVEDIVTWLRQHSKTESWISGTV